MQEMEGGRTKEERESWRLREVEKIAIRIEIFCIIRVLTIPLWLCLTSAGSWNTESSDCHVSSFDESDSTSVEGNSHNPASKPAVIQTQTV